MSKKIFEHNGKRIFLDSSKDKFVFELYWGGMGYPTKVYHYNRNGEDFYYRCLFTSWSTPEKLTVDEIEKMICDWNNERKRIGSFPRNTEEVKKGMIKLNISIPNKFGMI